ncbi:tetratricopeptide repeat protein [Myxococcota bacterium]
MAFSRGLLPQSSVGQILEHLGTCQSCGELIAVLSHEQESSDVVSDDESSATPLEVVGASDVSTTDSRNRYVLTKQIGMGGMGVVYAAYDVLLDRQVALKLLRAAPGDALRSASGRARLTQEARALARLTHANVVRVYDAGWMDARFFVAMELVEGQSLGAWLAETAGDWRSIRDVFVQAGQGLAAAHAAGLVHRDFKPDNVVVGTDGQVRVMDFGLVALVRTLEPEPVSEPGETPAPQHERKVLVGTPAYMAPEQAAGEPTDAQADQYSFCVALHEALLGERPKRTNSQEERAPPAFETPRLPSSGIKAPGWILKKVLTRGLQTNPERRFPSMAALLAQLSYDPRTRVRRWSSVVAVVVVLLGVAFGYEHAQRQRAGACAQAVQGLAGVWNPQKSKLVQEAFVATGAPYATTSWQTVDRVLSGHVEKWRAQRGDLCQSSDTLFGGYSTTGSEMRLHCLECRKSELEALVAVFEKADGGVVEHAAQAVANLTPVHRCSGLESPNLPNQWPDDPEVQSALRRLSDEKAAVLAMLHAGQGVTAIPRAEALVAKTRGVEYQPILADVLLLAGKCHLAAGAYTKAEETFWEAVGAAEQAGHDETRIRALLGLATIRGNVKRRVGEAVLLTRLARATMGRMGAGVEPEVKGELADLMAQLAFYEGRPATARAHAEEALRFTKPVLGSEAPKVWWLQSLLAWILKDLGQFDEALRLAQQSLARRTEALGDSHPEVGKGLYNLAGVYLDRRESGLAVSALMEARDIASVSMGPDHLLSLRFSAALAEAFHQDGQTEMASKEISRVLPVLRKVAGLDNPRVAELMAVEGKVLLSEGRIRHAAKVLEECLMTMEKNVGKDHPWLAGPLIDLGEAHRREGMSGTAIKVLERAMELLNRAEGGYVSEAARARFALARAIVSQTGEYCGRAQEQAQAARCLLSDIASYREEELGAVDEWLQTARESGCSTGENALSCGGR